ncbi:MAG: helix-turn-helix domain-containing protein [Desulfobaccales bacterium]
MADEDRLVRPREAAVRLGKPKSTIYAWLHSGKLPGVQVSERTVRIRESVVREMENVPESPNLAK